MFDANMIANVIGRGTFAAINASDLPKPEAMTLLHIWTMGSRQRLRDLAQSGQLLEVLHQTYGAALEHASEVRMSNMHLTQVECLQQAGVPLVL